MRCNATSDGPGREAKPQLIATLADFVLWCATDEPDRNVELSPQMQEFVEESLKHRPKI